MSIDKNHTENFKLDLIKYDDLGALEIIDPDMLLAVAAGTGNKQDTCSHDDICLFCNGGC